MTNDDMPAASDLLMKLPLLSHEQGRIVLNLYRRARANDELMKTARALMDLLDEGPVPSMAIRYAVDDLYSAVAIAAELAEAARTGGGK